MCVSPDALSLFIDSDRPDMGDYSKALGQESRKDGANEKVLCM
jgi:hypothetical protein